MQQVLTVEPSPEVADREAVFFLDRQDCYYWASLRRTLVRRFSLFGGKSICYRLSFCPGPNKAKYFLIQFLVNVCALPSKALQYKGVTQRCCIKNQCRQPKNHSF